MTTPMRDDRPQAQAQAQAQVSRASRLVIWALTLAVVALGVLAGFLVANRGNGNTAQNTQLSNEVATLSRELAQQQNAIAAVKATESNAVNAHLGVCWAVQFSNPLTGPSAVDSVSIYQATVTNGVYSCPGGGTFTPVTATSANNSQEG